MSTIHINTPPFNLMLSEINQLLKKTEVLYNIKILYACESGSRAWEFASPNSDYDIRFIYQHNKEHYLSVFDNKDSIEIPIKDDLDPGGWDIRKALSLLTKSNGALIEWLHSPIVYVNENRFRETWQQLAYDIIDIPQLSNHYLGLANRIRHTKLTTSEPSAKSYLYSCRAILASQWTREKQTAPPVPFSEVLEIASQEIKDTLTDLVKWKADAEETASYGRIPALDEFINNTLDDKESWLPNELKDKDKNTALVNQEFHRILNFTKKRSSFPSIKTQKDFTLERIRMDDTILLDSIAGSHAYGTSTAESDIDRKGIFVSPTNYLTGRHSIEQVSDKNNDEVYYELTRFFSLLEKNNPTALELLYTPEDCIKRKHPAFDLIRPEVFLSKLCEQTFAGYATAQIRKARGLNKKIVNPQPEKRKHLKSFCYILEGQGSVDLNKWLLKNKIKEKDCALVACRHAPTVYAIFHNKDLIYRGIFSKNSDSSLLCSSVPLGEQPIAWLSCNFDAFKTHCREHKEYWSWVSLRNEERYKTNATHGLGYDSKNMMHTLRLLDMAIEIATEKRVNVRRANSDWLLQIKNGDYSYDELLNLADEKLIQIKKAFTNCDLPEKPDADEVTDLLIRTREEFLK